MRHSKLFKSILLWLVDEDMEYGLAPGNATASDHLLPTERLEDLSKTLRESALPLAGQQPENLAGMLLYECTSARQTTGKCLTDDSIYDRFKYLLLSDGIFLNDNLQQFDRREWALRFLSDVHSGRIDVKGDEDRATQLHMAVSEVQAFCKELTGSGQWASRIGTEKEVQGRDQLPPLPEKAPAKWPDDKLPGEKSMAFFERHYSEYFGHGAALVSHLAKIDEKLSVPIATAISRAKRKGDLPGGFIAGKTRSEQVDEELQRLKIKTPTDAYNLDLPLAEKRRLYSAARERRK